jgi:hypothetical protein
MGYDNPNVTALLRKTNAFQNTLEFLQDRVQAFDGEMASFNTVASVGLLLGSLWDSGTKKQQSEAIGVLFDYLKRYPSDQKAIMLAFSGLQPIASTPLGAITIAQYDPESVGKRKKKHGHKGVDFLMDTLKKTSSNLGVQQKDGMTARSELLHIADLIMNQTEAYDKAFMANGLVDSIVTTMNDESNKRTPNSVSCKLLHKLFQRGKRQAILPTLQEGDVANLISASLKHNPEWKLPAPEKWNGMNLPETYRVFTTYPSCGRVLEQMP